MPIAAIPFEQLEVAVALKVTGELTLLLFAGDVTNTPVPPLTVIVIGVELDPPQ
jgi:hypothetical protein